MAKSKTKFILFTGLGLFVTASILYMNSWANQSVSNFAPENAVEGVSTTKEFTSLKTELFSTRVASDLTVKTQDKDGHGNILSQTFLTSSKTTPGRPITDQLAITVGTLPSQGLKGLSDVQFRLQREGIYTLDEEPYPEPGSLTFLKTGNGYEKSIFWTHNNLYAVVVVSGTIDRIEELDLDLSSAIDSWEWSAE